MFLLFFDSVKYVFFKNRKRRITPSCDQFLEEIRYFLQCIFIANKSLKECFFGTYELANFFSGEGLTFFHCLTCLIILTALKILFASISTNKFMTYFIFLDMADPNFTPEEVQRLLFPKEGEPMDTGTGAKSSTATNTDGREMVSVGTDPQCRSRTLSTTSSVASTSTAVGCLPRAYANVRAARKDSNTVRPLYGSAVTEHDLGTFLNNSDGRVGLANHRHCYKTKTNISSSFTLDTMICTSCVVLGRHRVLRRETEREDTVD
jgi:hypothetical protein